VSRGEGQPIVVFHMILTVDNSAHDFVIASVLAGLLTSDLNPRSNVYSVFHVRYKN